MAFQFSAKKAAQLVSKLLDLAGKRDANVMWALKLLYIADRESLRNRGVPLSGDVPYAMPHGPVLSRIYDLFKTAADFPTDEDDPDVALWRQFFERAGYDFRVKRPPGDDELSPAEIGTLEQVLGEHGGRSPFELRDLTHGFPEWRNNEAGPSSSPIPLADILEAVGRRDDVTRCEQLRGEEHYFDQLFGVEQG